MHRFSKTPSLLLSSLILTVFAQSAIGQEPVAETEKEKKKPQVRIICVSSLKEDQEVVLASKSKEGEWNEICETKLKSPLISPGLPAKHGRLSLALREGDGPTEISAFTYPEGARRAVVVIFPNGKKGKYHAEVFDPAKLGFVKGTTLVINYSKLPGAVALGSLKTTVQPGQSKVVKARPDPNGMYRLLAAYEGKDKESVVCYDRYIPDNKESRDILFLLPDKTLGLRVFSLSEFGPFE